MRIHVSFVGLSLSLVAASAFAQEVVTTPAMPLGGPQPGVEVQYRYSNPSASQQILTAQPAATATPAAGGQGASLATADGEEPTFMNDSISSVSSMGGAAGGMAMVLGASIYRGITPNEHDSLPHISRYQARAGSGSNQLTWIGFQPFEEYTRVFLQTGAGGNPQLMPSPDGMTLTVRLASTSIPLSNFRRDVDASYFDRAVTHIRAVRNGTGTDVVIELGRSVRYEMMRDDANPNYVYVDFYDNEQAE
jgi:hypothetical protein